MCRERAGAADGDYFGMGRWIVAGGDEIRTFGDHAAVTHDEGRERAAGSAPCVFHRETDGSLHEFAGIQRESFAATVLSTHSITILLNSPGFSIIRKCPTPSISR